MNEGFVTVGVNRCWIWILAMKKLSSQVICAAHLVDWLKEVGISFSLVCDGLRRLRGSGQPQADNARILFF